MRRADRLFQIIQILRRGRVVTARKLAEELEVSERTIYRDINDLVCSKAPIEGEAGVGYVMRDGYDLPPLMFTADEIEALALGASVVSQWADPGLAKASKSALSKIETVIPKELSKRLRESPVFSVNFRASRETSSVLALLRPAVHERRKVRYKYVRADGTGSERTVRPLCLSFTPPVWMMSGWCELRDEFRTFRVDRMADVSVLSDVFEDESGKTLEDFLAMVGATRNNQDRY